jgi:host factor-I protein
MKMGKKIFLQSFTISAMIFPMEVSKEESRQAIEPQFLSQAQASGINLHIGQMNKTVHEGPIRDIGRYEINLEENGRIITILKQEISYLTAPHPVIIVPGPQQTPGPADLSVVEPSFGKPNIQQEFLDKAIKENQLLTLYLINGQRVRAHIEAYDSFTILLKEDGKQHLYYKHSISTINR